MSDDVLKCAEEKAREAYWQQICEERRMMETKPMMDIDNLLTRVDHLAQALKRLRAARALADVALTAPEREALQIIARLAQEMM